MLRKPPRSLLIFYILVLYVFFQFCWWSYLLFDLNAEIYQLKLQLIKIGTNNQSETAENLIEFLEKKQNMIIGEGLVFLFLLVLGMLQTRKSFKRESRLARQQRNFMLSITHELKSPIASVKLYLQTLGKRDFEKVQKQNLVDRALQETERLDQLVENILLATQIDNHALLIQKERINLSDLVNNFAIQSLGLSLSEPISLHIEPNLFVDADYQAIESILKNLIENAVKYSPGNPQLAVKLFRKDECAILQLSDQGIGIEEQERAKVFQKFYRSGNEETRRTKGTGLGLYIVKFLIQQHNGSIEISDNLPKGSIFTIQLKLE
jgi:two-component system phosphate regulon sensor histidine kinase PhoR